MEFIRESFSSTKGDPADFEAELTLSDKLKTFKSSTFDPDSYICSKCRTMNEKVSVFSFPFSHPSSCTHIACKITCSWTGNKALVALPYGFEEGFCRGNAQKCLC